MTNLGHFYRLDSEWNYSLRRTVYWSRYFRKHLQHNGGNDFRLILQVGTIE